MGSGKPVRLRLTSKHLRCVQVAFCHVENITVVDCPNLERLFLWGFMDQGSCGIRFKVGHAPKLHQLGFLEPGVHMLEIGDTVVNPLTNVQCILHLIIPFPYFEFIFMLKCC